MRIFTSATFRFIVSRDLAAAVFVDGDEPLVLLRG
jgi:hypothetical protein